MTPEQKQLVKHSWARILPIQESAAELFYGRLFETHPEVRAYFRGDMRQQGRKLMAMLNTAVNGLDKLEALTGPLKRSGRAHAEYGVQAEDYDKVGDALLWALAKGLGEAFTPEVEAAWSLTYRTLAATMIDGAAYAATGQPADGPGASAARAIPT